MDENTNKPNGENEAPKTPEEKSFKDIAGEFFSAAKKTAAEAAAKAKTTIQQKADETDLDEKAADFFRTAGETAKNAFSTAVEKTKDFIEDNDLDIKARELGNTISDKTKEIVENVKDAFGDDDNSKDGK